MRLQKYLAQGGLASRRRAEDLIAAGSVKVNGKVVTTLGTTINPGKDRVEVEGRRVLVEDPVYRLLLKPRACLATLAKSGERPTLARYVKDAEAGWQVAAPLDFPAEGVVLITSDGVLAQALTKSGKVPMTYHIKLQGLVGDTVIERLKRGWRWEGRPVKPTAVEALAVTEKNTWVEIVVPEARPRALKAVGDLVRHSVLKVSRVRLGGLSFEGLKMGEWRDLTKGEIADLRKRAGLAPPA
ncbi:MAG TPA: S4 domain-containing protein [Polyangia bacterium]|nr:S4 domain-containing protein [Polyangia bacterium]